MSEAVEPVPEAPAVEEPPPRGGDLVRRHAGVTRLWHWVNALTLLVLLMSGLMIFNAHPRLYWGQYGANRDHAWLQIGGRGEAGAIKIGGAAYDTSGVLGSSTGPDGRVNEVAFPHWATIPSGYSLADARLWHFFFAWVLALGLLLYLVWGLLRGHIRRDLHITRTEWRPAHIWHDITEHIRLRFPTGAAALRYNVLQKLAYCGVLFGLLPLIIFTGLTMSPGIDAAVPWLVDLLGGRQSARSLHFLAAFGLVLFFLVHIAMVVLAGPFNEVRSMITGWYRLPKDRP